MRFIQSVDIDAGFREGPRGTHSSRTLMRVELERVLRSGAVGEEVDRLVLEENLLEKATTSGRSLTLQRLRELYAFDEALPLYRVLRELWRLDSKSLPLLALLAALARDPLLRATAPTILELSAGSEVNRTAVKAALATAVGSRMSEATLDKVVRNALSSWAQSGHLSGRTFKVRTKVFASPSAMAFAIWLAQAAGWKGQEILESGWVKVLDCDSVERSALLERTRAAGLVQVRQLGATLEIDASRRVGTGASG